MSSFVSIAPITCPAFEEGRGALTRESLSDVCKEFTTCSSSTWPVLELRVTAEPDPGALARVLERFQNQNVLPRRVLAQWASNGMVHVEVEVSGLSEEALNLIAAKLGQVPCIASASWHRV